MKKTTKQGIIFTLFIILLLVIDQVIKILVKTNMCLHESIHVTDWFYISFIENKGMAYGMSVMPKVVLSLFRLLACVALVWYIRKQILAGARKVWITLLAMIAAGAMGNLVDCMFYGQIFTESNPFTVSYLTDFGYGYAPFLEGRVVDMFYFPLIVTTYPDWFPMWGGEPFIFFSPVFNFADSCISVGVVALLLFCRKELAALSHDEEEKGENADSKETADNVVVKDE